MCHPQTDGQSEVVNRCLETYLRCFSCEQPKKWQHWFAWAEYWYNTTFHVFTNTTSFWAMYGHDPPPLIRYGNNSSGVVAVEQQLQDRDMILDELKNHLQRAQAKTKKQANIHRRDVNFSIGDFVYLKLRPYCLRSLAQWFNEKLSPRFFGPFKVVRQIGNVAYELELPSTSKLHPIFHVSQLKPAKGTLARCLPLPPHLSTDFKWIVENEQILSVRTKPDSPYVLTYVFMIIFFNTLEINPNSLTPINKIRPIKFVFRDF